MAEQLIRDGVRCVVAAGWAVEDGPAKRFADRLLPRLLAGDRFIEAVGAARRAAWEARKAGNTWAAYQCYGDPDWRFVPPADDDDVASVAMPELWTPSGLALMLETEALAARHGDDRSDARRYQAARRRRLQLLRALQARYEIRLGRHRRGGRGLRPGLCRMWRQSTPRSTGMRARCAPATAARRCEPPSNGPTTRAARRGPQPTRPKGGARSTTRSAIWSS